MDDKGFVAARNRLGLENSSMAELLGMTPHGVRRYVNGNRKVPEPVARFLRLIIALGLSAKDVEDTLKGQRK
jgi:plasmid maintenance system antidote protein VapI